MIMMIFKVTEKRTLVYSKVIRSNVFLEAFVILHDDLIGHKEGIIIAVYGTMFKKLM